MYTLPYVCVSVLSLFEQRGRCESTFVSPMKMHKSYYMYIPSLHKQILKTLSFWCWWLFNLSKLFNSFNEMMCMICAFTCILYFLTYSMVLPKDRVLIWKQLFDQLNCSTNLEVQLFNFNFHSTISNSSMKWVYTNKLCALAGVWGNG